jgi:NtrC-family two-component system sensor histidine kinase KinB
MRRLQTRFILAGWLLIATTVGGGVWSALTFARLSSAAEESLRESQAKIDLSAALASSLEREDDALLLAISGDTARASRALRAERARGDGCLRDLLGALSEPEQQEFATALQDEVKAYRDAGSTLLETARRPDALARYHKDVNPLLRQAVALCGKVREENFTSMRLAGVRARDEARKATGVVGVVSVVAVALAAVILVWLARSVLRPVSELTASVEALRLGDFDRRVPPASTDELDQLAAGFNRMAETLGEYRRSSLGELLTAKITLEATLNALPDAVLVVGPDGTLDALNPPARAILGAWGAADARSLRDLALGPEQQAAVEAALAGKPSVSPRTDFGRALVVELAGRPRKFFLTVSPIPELAPRQNGAVIVLDDVTEFARLDELRSELIGVASHELKTPLTTLRMNLLLLGEQAQGLTAQQREMLDAALLGCEDLAATIDELLDVTRIEAGQLRLELAPVDLVPILSGVVRSLAPRFDDAGVRVQVSQEGAPRLVWGDTARLRIVFTNLLTNALKYSPPGSTVTVRLSGQNTGIGGSNLLHITVTDAGPGVPAEFRERIFEKFFRVEQQLGSGKSSPNGTGIGLYLCREIIKAHGGAIHCEPANQPANGPGPQRPAGAAGGTRIAFYLPAPNASTEEG